MSDSRYSNDDDAFADASNPYRQGYGDVVVPPAKQGWSTGTKVLIGFGAVAGLLLLACCGVFGWLAYEVRSGLVQDPAEIAKLRDEIVSEIDLPDEYQPQLGLKMGLFDVTVVFYGNNPEGAGLPILMLMQMPPGADPDQMRREMEKAAGRRQAEIEQSETKTLLVDGEMVDFQFAQGKAQESGQKVRQVMGILSGKRGPVMVLLVIAEENWDEEKAMEILESIKR